MLHVAGGKAGQHQGVIELALGKGGHHAEFGLVAQLKAGGGISVGREALVALQHLTTVRAKGSKALLAKPREGEIGAVDAVEQLPVGIVLHGKGVVGCKHGRAVIINDELAAHASYVIQHLGVFHCDERG